MSVSDMQPRLSCWRMMTAWCEKYGGFNTSAVQPSNTIYKFIEGYDDDSSLYQFIFLNRGFGI